MFPTLLIRQCLVTSLLLLVAATSQALTLGRVRGAVLIGQPLNVEVLLTLAADENTNLLCLEADVFHADTLVAASKISVAVAAAGAGQALLRIRSQAVVDEPFVMLFVRAGCIEKVTRRYVLLADVANEAAAPGAGITPVPVPAVIPPAKSSVVGVLIVPADTALPKTGTTNKAVRRRSGKPAFAAAEPPLLTAKEPGSLAIASAKPRKAITKSKQIVKPFVARLVIDPLEPAAERDPVLKLSPELLTTESVPQRAASAALWRALNAQPLDLLRDIERIERLEAQANTVRIQNAQQQERIDALAGQLQKAQAERYDNPLIYALYGLLALALVGSGYFWWRGRRAVMSAPAWWLAQNHQTAENENLPFARPARFAKQTNELSKQKILNAKPQAQVEAAERQRKEPNAPIVSNTLGDLDLDLSKSVLRTRRNLPRPQPMPSAKASSVADFGHSQPGRAVNAEELIDIQQQADFFVSLGQYDQAINVLKDHIRDSVQTSAVAYLDLLEIYHSTDRKMDYGMLRDEFQKVFNAHAPKFADFGVRTRGLESYFVAMARIQALWPSPKVLDVIEESIFRKPGEADGEAFDLEAYRDLILLHTLVKILMQDDPSNLEHSAFPSTDIQPLSATTSQGLPLQEAEATADLFKPPASMRLGLDFDLSKLDTLESASAERVETAPFLAHVASIDMRLEKPFELSLAAKEPQETPLPNKPSA